MSNVECKVSGTRRSIAPKEISVFMEKENDPPISRTSRVRKLPSVSCLENCVRDGIAPKRKLSLGQVELKREDSRSTLGPVKVNTRRPSFHVHCDEKSQEKPSAVHDTKGTCTEAKRNVTKFARSISERESKIPVRRTPSVVRSESVNANVENIPRRPSRLGSTEVTNKCRVAKTSLAGAAVPPKVKASRVEPKKAQVPEVPSKSLGAKSRSLASLRLRTGRETVVKRQVSVAGEHQKNDTTITSRVVSEKRMSDILESRKSESGISHPSEAQDSGVAEMSTISGRSTENPDGRRDSRRDSEHQEPIPCTSGSIITPIDGPPLAPLLPVKVLIKRAKETAIKAARLQPKKQDFTIASHLSVELAYHMEYQDDLVMTEREKEKRAPLLSATFLRRYINGHQRKEIVAYLLHLGLHCRYPSFVIYQTVKLFDAVMDRLPVETDRLQLTALAALWINLKRLEVYRKLPSATTIVELAKEMYIGREDLLMAYERKVLQAVDFNISFADPFSVLAHYIIKCKRTNDIPEETTALIYHYGGYMIDLTMLDERFCRLRATLLAFVVAELAVVLVQHSSASVVELKTRWDFSMDLDNTDSFLREKTEAKQLNGLRTAIIRSIRDSGNKRSGYDIVYKKYNRSKYGCVSKLLVERIKTLPSLNTELPL